MSKLIYWIYGLYPSQFQGVLAVLFKYQVEVWFVDSTVLADLPCMCALQAIFYYE